MAGRGFPSRRTVTDLTIRTASVASDDTVATISQTCDSKSFDTDSPVVGTVPINQGQSIACGTHLSSHSRCQGVVFVAVSGLAKEHVHQVLSVAGGKVLEVQDEDEEDCGSDSDDSVDN